MLGQSSRLNLANPWLQATKPLFAAALLVFSAGSVQADEARAEPKPLILGKWHSLPGTFVKETGIVEFRICDDDPQAYCGYSVWSDHKKKLPTEECDIERFRLRAPDKKGVYMGEATTPKLGVKPVGVFFPETSTDRLRVNLTIWGAVTPAGQGMVREQGGKDCRDASDDVLVADANGPS